jgi:hypothetical protein
MQQKKNLPQQKTQTQKDQRLKLQPARKEILHVATQLIKEHQADLDYLKDK